MKLKDITQKDVLALANSKTALAKGMSYYRGERVKSLSIKDKTITARVKGNYGIYTVKIFVDDEGIEADCSCPYCYYGCKHAVAVLYKWVNEKKEDNALGGRQTSSISIPFEDIEKTIPTEPLAKAFDLIKNDKVVVRMVSRDRILAEVDDIKKETVTIERSRWAYQNTLFTQCSCNRSAYSKGCCHIAAVKLKLLPEEEKGSVVKYEAKVRARLRRERFDALVNNLSTAIPELERIKEREYGLFFNVSGNEEKVSISIEKALILKRGGISQLSHVSEKFLTNYYDKLPEAKKKIFELFILSLKMQNGHYWYSNNSLVKDRFETALDFEVLNRLRNLYKEDPSCFHNCAFPEEKASVEININAGQKNFTFTLSAKLNLKKYALNDKTSIVTGGNHLWVYARDDKGEHALFELETKHPDMVKKLAKTPLTEITAKQLKSLIENHYLALSKLGEVTLPENYHIEEKTIKPIPRIFLSDYTSSFSIELRFLYGTHEVEHNNNQDIVFRNEKDKLVKIKRDKEEEKKLHSTLLENNTIEKHGLLIPSTDPYTWLVDTAKNLISLGYEIYGKEQLFNQKINAEEPQLTVNISSGIDWFDLKGNVKFGDEEAPFDKVLDALKNHERFIKLSDGSIGVIPEKWLKKLSGVSGFLDYDEKAKKLRASNSQIAIVEALIGLASKSKTDQQFKQLREKFKHFKEIKNMPLPKSLEGSLRDYQKVGYDWLHFLKEFSFGGCLADDMGLGKTVQVLSLILYEKESGNKTISLVVVPTSLVFNWVNEIKKFTPALKPYVHHGQDRLRSMKGIMKKGADMIITTYGTLRNDLDLFKDETFHYIILDESQQIKNPLSKNAKSTYSLKSKHKLILTGTPVENNSLDLWSQFAFLNPGLLGNMEYFKKTFTKSIERDQDKDKTEALRNMISPFLLSRKKETVAKELPEKQITTLFCEMDGKQRKAYDCWKEKYKEEIRYSILNKGFMQSKMKILQGLTRLRQICNHPVLVDESYTGESGKFNTLMSHIEEVINGGHKALIFSSFVKMLQVFKNHFNKQNIKFSYLDGRTKHRKEIIEEFQEDEEIKVFLISLKAGGLGLNLTAADYVFIVDPWWNHAQEMKAIDRTYSTGQKNNVLVYKAIMKDSIEEKILELQEKKLDLVKNIITIEDGIFKKLSQEDIKAMFT